MTEHVEKGENKKGIALTDLLVTKTYHTTVIVVLVLRCIKSLAKSAFKALNDNNFGCKETVIFRLRIERKHTIR